jgi:hypothetical protein
MSDASVGSLRRKLREFSSERFDEIERVFVEEVHEIPSLLSNQWFRRSLCGDVRLLCRVTGRAVGLHVAMKTS